MDFQTAVDIILRLEGGYVANKNDPGGETNMGISKRAYPWLDIPNLTREEAKKIYHADYWAPLKLDEMPPKLRLILFDSAVNHGVRYTVATLQAILALPVDGIVGERTIKSVQAYSVPSMIEKIAYRRLDSYASSRNWVHFGKGWARRLLEIAVRSI